MLDVALVLADPLTRAGVQAALSESPETRVVSLLDSVEDLEANLAEVGPDALILDVRFRRADPDLIPRLSTRFPDLKILIYVCHPAEDCVLRLLMAAGDRAHLSSDAVSRLDECCLTSLRHQAHGCIPSEASKEDVVRAVQAAADGDVAAAPWLSQMAGQSIQNDNGTESSRAITARELEVMALLAEGMGNKAIGRELGIREQTVKNHLARIMDKLGLSNRVQVGLLAAKHNLKLDDSAR